MKKLFFLFLFLFSFSAYSAGFTVAFSAPTSGPTPSGYVLFIGTSSGNYTLPPIDMGNVLSYAVSGLQNNTKYYVAAKSYIGTSYAARTDLSTSYSNEVSVTTPSVLQPPGNLSIQNLVTWNPLNELQDGVSYNMGLKFTPLVNGQLLGIYYWQAANEPLTQKKATLYNTATKARMMQITFTPSPLPGWKLISVAIPKQLTAGTSYTVSVTRRWYGYKTNTFPLRTNIFNVNANSGVYTPTLSAMPNLSWNNSDYGTDILFTPTN